MSRYIYSNLLKMIFGSIFTIISLFSIIYFGCSLLIDKVVSIPSIIIICLCLLFWIIVISIISLLNKFSNNRIIFENTKIKYRGKTFYYDNVNIKYFKFFISFIEPSLVFPKIHINGNGLSVICYLSKKDIKRLMQIGYTIKIV